MIRNLQSCRADQQNGRSPGRPRKPKSPANSVGRSISRPIFTMVDRLVDRAQVTWDCARRSTGSAFGRPVGRPQAAQKHIF